MSHDSSLEPVLRAVEPAARLVPERHLRQVLHYLIDRGWALPTNPGLPFWVPRDQLVAAELLPSRVLEGAEPKLLLITDPNDRMIDRLPAAEQLREYWRVLFRAAVLREFDRRWDLGDMDPERATRYAEVNPDQFGPAVAREIAHVLEAEHLAPADGSRAAYFRMFAAVYLDLAAFDRHALEHYFPSLRPGDADRALGAMFDVPALLAASRPAGAADPHPEEDPAERWAAADTHAAMLPGSPADVRGLLDRALEAEQRGNNVRAAILRTQAAAGATGEDRELALGGARTALGKLVDALGDVFDWDHETRQEWRQALAPLLTPATAGVWPRAARCLYELQKIPADLAREVYAVDLAETIRTFGRRPVKRPLPHARPVLILMHLKKAHAQMLRAGLGHASQLRLDRLFHHQGHKLEHDIRHDFTPVIVAALTAAGLTPANPVEEVGRDKLVAELLDRVCERGYLRIGDLRDAIARNRLKMADLSGPGEFFRGDALLRADLTLAYALDGVYRKGEFYLRGLQWFSSLFFATTLGRLFTLYVALPFGGAFLTLMFLEELRHIGGKLASLVVKPAAAAKAPPPDQPPRPQPPPDVVTADEVELDDDGETVWVTDLKPGTITSETVDVGEDGEVVWSDPTERFAIAAEVFRSSAVTAPPDHHHGSVLIAWPTIVGFGVFLLLMFHAPPFRRAVFAALGYAWWGVRGVLWDVPVGVWRSPAVRGLRQSRPVRLLARHFWSPLLITALLFGVLFLVGVNPRFLLRWGWAVWAGLTVAYNTPWGWVIQDRIAETVSDWWRVVRVNLLPGLIATIIDWFRMLANWIERQLYAVDEWLRFRGGDSQGSLALKAVLGLIWFPIAYTFRFVFYLLVEPQVNPVKHFPVVTVSHKVIWPMVPQLAEMTGISPWTVGMVINGIPGIFGFIAWELKENWRLYAANRGDRLRPVTLGGHGETMRGLLRPGFHSGTVPKLYRKMRHADHASAGRLHHELEHAGEAVHRFAERELVHLLARSPDWGGLDLRVGHVRFGSQRATLELLAPGLGRDGFVVAFENVGGRIGASVEQTGWADKLTPVQRAALVAALRGLCDMAAAERFDGRERVADAPAAGDGSGFADLARRVPWAEWVARWNAPAKA